MRRGGLEPPRDCEGVSCGLLFHYCPACLNVFVSRVVQTGLTEFGTLLAHIWPQGTPVDALEDLINLFGFIDLEWSHPPGLNPSSGLTDRQFEARDFSTVALDHVVPGRAEVRRRCFRRTACE